MDSAMDDFASFDRQFQDQNCHLSSYNNDQIRSTQELSEEAKRLNHELFLSCNLLRPPQLTDDVEYPIFRSTPTSPTTRAIRHYGPAPTPLLNEFGVFSAPISPRLQNTSLIDFPSFYFKQSDLDNSLATLYHQPIVQDEFDQMYFQPQPLNFSQGVLYPPQEFPQQFTNSNNHFPFNGEEIQYFENRVNSLNTQDPPNPVVLPQQEHWIEVPQDGAVPESGSHALLGQESAAPENIYQPGGSTLEPSQPASGSCKDKFKLKVSGIPLSGARSRVETQIKLCLKLISTEGGSIQEWSHIRLPYFMTVGERGRRIVKGSSRNVMEERVLNLRVWVVCATDTKRRVKVCNGCIHRERKRQTRRSTLEPSQEEGACSALSEAESVEREQLKIAVFNCSKLLNFHTGDVILPTRLTCYCRHHQENIGFILKFAVFDHKGNLVATGRSPPVMITDDHKTRSKARQHDYPEPKSSQSPLELNQALAELLPQRPDRLTHNSPVLSPVNVPTIGHIVPNQGPIQGGCEVAILGENFNGDMSVYFGDFPAPVIRLWSPHSAICLLPPIGRATPVLVTVGLHGTVPTGNHVFTYVTPPEELTMGSALRLLNYQTTGFVEDPEEIAARVLGVPLE
ncbi:SPT3 Dosage dependent suppressor of Ty-induced promoter mutations-like protein [Entomophthora muscae]|uniref:SPT3 Dosage dependent suppressor of Ty-induced promoter mutations-like protein n=1 Tax=Entomophthora muscae TaxID=34485 RepID=A0ACC2T261_9FUNG|nr:SPT3 Dosage dependent suppressor of Ty-induced promoter mutations-like protein [Entomophthora muscae]